MSASAVPHCGKGEQRSENELFFSPQPSPFVQKKKRGVFAALTSNGPMLAGVGCGGRREGGGKGVGGVSSVCECLTPRGRGVNGNLRRRDERQNQRQGGRVTQE